MINCVTLLNRMWHVSSGPRVLSAVLLTKNISLFISFEQSLSCKETYTVKSSVFKQLKLHPLLLEHAQNQCQCPRHLLVSLFLQWMLHLLVKPLNLPLAMLLHQPLPYLLHPARRLRSFLVAGPLLYPSHLSAARPSLINSIYLQLLSV